MLLVHVVEHHASYIMIDKCNSACHMNIISK